MSFIKKIENFVCERCGTRVQGTGYTNHCPVCLWSKHVDVSPGDRQAICGGLMKPVDLYLQNQNWTIIHQCEKCGQQSKNKIASEDDFEAVLKLEKEINEKKVRGNKI